MDFLTQLIGSPLLAALVAVGGVLATIWFTNRRERDRLEHERALRLRDERIAAYRKLLAATTTAHTERKGVQALAAASEEISLLAGSPELRRAADKVWVYYGAAQRTADKTKKDPANTSAGDFAKALDRRGPLRRSSWGWPAGSSGWTQNRRTPSASPGSLPTRTRETPSFS